MEERITIRPYADNDSEQVLCLLRLNTPYFFAAEEERDLLHYLQHERELYYVLEAGEKIVGCGGVNFIYNGLTARISWDIFHPAYQGRSLGSRLLQYRIDRIKEYCNVRQTEVRTSQKAFKFYEKGGFVLREVVEDYWAKGFHLYRMEYSEPLIN